MRTPSAAPVRLAGTALLTLVAVVACSDVPMAPETAMLSSRFASTGLPTPPGDINEKIVVCKVGPSASFEVTPDGGSTTVVQVADGACVNVFSWPGGDNPFGVTVTELASTTFMLDSIVIAKTRDGEPQGPFTEIGTNTHRADIAPGKGAILTFFNTPKPPTGGGEGCTPGYWKQSQHFDSWVGYTPGTLFASAFGVNAFPGKTLLQVLGQGGGGLNALGRHAVAALLNTANASVHYDIASSADVIAAFGAVFPGGDYEGLKNRFATLNELGCPLN